METKYITKASGEREAFNIKKFQRSLYKSGAPQSLIDELTQEVLQAPDLHSTRDIYNFAFRRLKQAKPAYAARYNLKYALSELGPSGFPFERFVAEIFKEQGYETQVDQTLQGFCVTHEVDVIFTKGTQRNLVECKYHQPHLKANVKVPLYIKARFDDIEKKYQSTHLPEHKIDHAWIVTNTKFTSDAITYAQCVRISLLSWSFPEGGSLADLVEKLQFHPITSLTSLSTKQKQQLIEQGVVLCKDISSHTNALRNLGFSNPKIERIVEEAHNVCALTPPPQ